MPKQLDFFQMEPSFSAPEEARDPPEAPKAAPSPKEGSGEFDRKLACLCLRQKLSLALGEPLGVKITDNTSSVLSYRPARMNEPATLRIHHMFLSAPKNIHDALGQWLKNRRSKKAAGAIDDYIRAHSHLLRPAKRRRILLRPKGRCYDLNKFYQTVNAEQFENAVAAHITWGPRSYVKPKRSIRFGSYCAETNVIRIHHLLDQDFVPDWFVQFVVYHEMLHAHMGVKEGANGRRRIHPPEFKAMEKAHPAYERAEQWAKDPRAMRRLLRGKG
jgi:predicted metal-dependent hydrolase